MFSSIFHPNFRLQAEIILCGYGVEFCDVELKLLAWFSSAIFTSPNQ